MEQKQGNKKSTKYLKNKTWEKKTNLMSKVFHKHVLSSQAER